MSRLVPLLLAVVSLGFAPAPFLRPKSGGDGGLLWKKVGLKLSAADRVEVARRHPKLKGGMTITDVRANSPASKAGIRKGDILIGLHQWETLNAYHVRYVLTHPDRHTFNPLQFYILRSGTVHRGWLHVKE
jgi:serine protease Do